jgi:hypothetical protein
MEREEIDQQRRRTQREKGEGPIYRDTVREGKNKVLNGLETHGMIVEHDLGRYQPSPSHFKFEPKNSKALEKGESFEERKNVEEKRSRE